MKTILKNTLEQITNILAHLIIVPVALLYTSIGEYAVHGLSGFLTLIYFLVCVYLLITLDKRYCERHRTYLILPWIPVMLAAEALCCQLQIILISRAEGVTENDMLDPVLGFIITGVLTIIAAMTVQVILLKRRADANKAAEVSEKNEIVGNGDSQHEAASSRILTNGACEKIKSLLIKRWFLPAALILLLVLGYFGLILSTSSVVRSVKKVYCGEIHPDPDSPISMYDLSKHYHDIAYAEMRVTPLLVIHNGRHGYMYVIYSNRYLDENNKTLNASCDIMSKWEIEKKDGEWTIIDIEEKP